MIYKYLSILIIIFFMNSKINASTVKNIKIGGQDFVLTHFFDQHHKGKYYFSSFSNIHDNFRFPTYGYMGIFNHSGETEFIKEIKSSNEALLPSYFTRNNVDFFSYFLIKFQNKKKYSRFHFVDKNFKNIKPFLIDLTQNFDPHVAYFTKWDTLFLMVKKSEKLFEIREYNRKGKVIFSWNTSLYHKGVDLDINGISLSPTKRLIVSSRAECKILIITYPHSKIVHEISYKTWRFKNDEFGHFCFQHFPIILQNGHLLLFDNGNGTRASRAVEYSLDYKNKIATLVWEYRSKDINGIYSRNGGFVYPLSDDELFINWGTANKMIENYKYKVFSIVSRKGKLITDLTTNTPVFLNGFHFKK